VDTFQGQAAAKGIALELDAGSAPLAWTFDYARLLQVLANLIANAMKFTPAGGRITVYARGQGTDLRISVRDTGAGISPHLLEAIFERFWQASADDRRGLGLGLYIARCIVEAHGGRIWAESTEGAGSTIHIVLPPV
jgi:signal transduction histidine kinase